MGEERRKSLRIAKALANASSNNNSKNSDLKTGPFKFSRSSYFSSATTDAKPRKRAKELSGVSIVVANKKRKNSKSFSLLDLPIEVIDNISQFLCLQDFFMFRCLTHSRIYRALEEHPDVCSILFLAILQGAEDVFERVFRKHRETLNITYAQDKLLKGICCWSRTNMLKLLLEDGRIDPSMEHNVALRIAAARQDFKTVKFLLQDPRVDPSDPQKDPFAADAGPHSLLREDDINALMCTIVNCDISIMRLLLKDHRVDPTAYRNFALHAACHFGRLDMIRLILEDGRINPSDHENSAIRSAISQGRYAAVELLLRDPRVLAAAEADPLNIRLLAESARHFKQNRIAHMLERWLRAHRRSNP